MVKYIKKYLIKRRKTKHFSSFFTYILLNGDEFMKQIIPFVKDVSLNTKISEITSIALEHNLQMENNDSIVGSFIVSGKYKINEISINEEVFEKEIPFDITLDDKYDASKVRIDIDDFYYEIINEEILRIHIDVLVDNLVYCKKEEINTKNEVLIEDDLRNDSNEEIIENIEENSSDTVNLSKEDDGEQRKEEECMNQEKKEDNLELESEILDTDVKRNDVCEDLSSNILSSKEEYVTYKVHIIRNDETIDMIKEKYNITKEELEKYNSLDNIVIGSKIIIPIKDE